MTPNDRYDRMQRHNSEDARFCADNAVSVRRRFLNEVEGAVAEERGRWLEALKRRTCDLHDLGRCPDDCIGCRILVDVSESETEDGKVSHP